MKAKDKELLREANGIADKILANKKPKKDKCMHCFGELASPIFCDRVKGHKGEHGARLNWEQEQGG